MGNPFVNATMEIRLDELLKDSVSKAVEDSGSALTVTVSEDTLMELSGSIELLFEASRVPHIVVLDVLDNLGITIRED